ncbi:MAG: hypothetical protein QOK48_2739, partial [Blastocatellia bacterium]|nr:hypothetical protein [Blastocatellia bacterium]
PNLTPPLPTMTPEPARYRSRFRTLANLMVDFLGKAVMTSRVLKGEESFDAIQQVTLVRTHPHLHRFFVQALARRIQLDLAPC